MGIAISGKYLGNKKMELTHGPSGVKLITAAPLDNQGDGSSFSPTDLVAAALGSCILTVISIYAERHAIDLAGSSFHAEKTMSTDTPRRIIALPVQIHLPAHLTQAQREELERVGKRCPVHASLGPEVSAPISYFYDAA